MPLDFEAGEEATRLMATLQAALIQADIENERRDIPNEKAARQIERFGRAALKERWFAKWRETVTESFAAAFGLGKSAFFDDADGELQRRAESLAKTYGAITAAAILVEVATFEPYRGPISGDAEKETATGVTLGTVLRTAQLRVFSPLFGFETTQGERLRSAVSDSLRQLRTGVTTLQVQLLAAAGLGAAVGAVLLGPLGGLIGGAVYGLSGAAATSAGLAALGGGALAVGGLGMAGGTTLLIGGGSILGLGIGLVSVTPSLQFTPTATAVAAAKLEAVLREVVLSPRGDPMKAPAILLAHSKAIAVLQERAIDAVFPTPPASVISDLRQDIAILRKAFDRNLDLCAAALKRMALAAGASEGNDASR